MFVRTTRKSSLPTRTPRRKKTIIPTVRNSSIAKLWNKNKPQKRKAESQPVIYENFENSKKFDYPSGGENENKANHSSLHPNFSGPDNMKLLTFTFKKQRTSQLNEEFELSARTNHLSEAGGVKLVFNSDQTSSY